MSLFLRGEDRGFNFIPKSGCFSSKYLTIVARIRDVVVTRGDQAVIGDEECGCARIVISHSFPNLLFTVCRSSIARPLSLLDTFLNYALQCGRRSFSFGRGLGGGGRGESAVNYGIDHNRLRRQLHAQDCSSRILLSSSVSL